jgi:diguanylate cyclase
VLLDLDHFKRVNDTWGHPAGDAVLRHVATLANTTVRSTDLVGRLGGEEFIVLLPNTSIDLGRRIAEKIRQRLEASVVTWEGQRIPVTASFGLSSTTPEDKRDFNHLYTEADKALYLAKQRGRNRVV